jgi:hypothetical protein
MTAVVPLHEIAAVVTQEVLRNHDNQEEVMGPESN